HSASTPDLAKRTCTGPASGASAPAAAGASLDGVGVAALSRVVPGASWPLGFGAATAAAAAAFGTVAAPKDSYRIRSFGTPSATSRSCSDFMKGGGPQR